MKIYNSLKIIKKFQKSIIAIGNFDGAHIGHQKIFNYGLKKAKKKGLKFGILTFDPHPAFFFNKNLKNHNIYSNKQKIENLKKLSIDFVVSLKFDKKFSKTSYKDFIKKILYKKLRSKFIIVSNNFKFGQNRKGDVSKLKELENKFDYKTIIIKPFKKNRRVISSTYIRNLIKNGKIKKANILLGRKWEIIEKVIKGDQRGKKIGYPTCNFNIDNYVLPKRGVYSVNIAIKGINKQGIANFGYRPTVGGKKLILEVNIFGFKKNLYNKELKIIFKKFLRGEKRFKNINLLKKQIGRDIKRAKAHKN